MQNGDLIIVGDFEQASSALAAFHSLAGVWFMGQGYTVGKDGVVAKDAEGNDRPDVQSTQIWDTLKPAPDGRYYWTSPSKRAEFRDWKKYLAASGYELKCDEIEKPAEWDEWLSENSE